MKSIDKQLDEMGGREEYQRASQLSTSFFSTSKWVLGSLSRRGWLHGISLPGESKKKRRETRLLEVGAINTELLDAADEKYEWTTPSGEIQTRSKYRLNVRAIDIHSMEERIEEIDFLELPFTSENPNERYDVIVCSMVLNCVTSSEKRGIMLARLYHHIRPGGLLFLTIPKFCLTKSAFLTPSTFLEMLGSTGVGFSVLETKSSPKVSFFVCRRPQEFRTEQLKQIWKKQIIRNRGKKHPNQFSVVLDENEIFGRQQHESIPTHRFPTTR